jgi:hypothetical protein
MSHSIGELRSGPLDIIGDVHGELDALLQLLKTLGYDAHGSHPQGRHLVFVGDLCDRGHDSPGVFSFVSGLVDRGRAQCVIGNHELNLLRNEKKEGNGWFHEKHDDHEVDLLRSSTPVKPQQRAAILAFLDRLPCGTGE